MRQLVADVQRLQAVCRLKSLIGIKFEALLCDSGRRGGVTRLRQFTAPRGARGAARTSAGYDAGDGSRAASMANPQPDRGRFVA
ncbi:hypothetical protein [Burkholderia pseudomallei]|uniref:hypothetical protein n=1 Tax=Burkholderia pseudomallei TaxID=28450 RepID=UPI0015E45A14|nr:hypothetical protein [Burkholderia pseudomallei]